MKKNVMLRELGAGARDAVDAARRPCPGGVAGQLVVEQHSPDNHAALGRDAPQARRRRRNGNPRLSGGQGEGMRHHQRRLVRAAVDLGLELRRDGIQGLLEVRVVAATVRLLEPLPRAQGAGRRRAGHVPA